jgi:long-chain fatty acid transport protein
MFAGGYQLNEHGARAVGMGGAFVARASDPSAIYFNPAGLAGQGGINILGGITLITPSTTFKGTGIMQPIETKTESQLFTPINLYGTYQINEQIVVGLGVYNPFGLGTKWPEYWGPTLANLGGVFAGSYSSVDASIQTFYFNPSVAYKINDELSVGLGISYVYGSVSMSKTIPFTHPLLGTSYFSLKMDGTGSGINFNLGCIYKIMPELSVGLSFRSTTEIEFSGDAKFTNKTVPATVYNGSIALLYPGGTGTATLPMPGSLTAGVAYQLMPALTLEADVQYVLWSAYDKLDVNLTPVVPGGQGSSSSIKNWEDGIILRGGGEYTLNPEITLRGGLILDISPQPPAKAEPMLPDSDKLDVALGGSYKINQNLSVDVSYMLVLFMERDAKYNPDVPGTYNSTAHVISVNFGYAL